MAYFPDLTLCTYGRAPYGPTLAIGWLDGSKPYTKGKAPLELLLKMKEWASNPRDFAINWTRGLHQSNLKKIKNPLNHSYSPDVFSTEGIRTLDNGEFHVHYKGKFYASPVMVFHYILDFDYLPPQEYIDAVLYGELVTEANMENFEEEGDEEISDEAIHDMFELANKEIKSGKALDALQTIKKLLAIIPNEPILYALRGTAYYELGELQKAQADLELILFNFKKEGGQNYAHIFTYLGKIANDEGNPKQAKIYFQRALSAYPGDQEARELLDPY